MTRLVKQLGILLILLLLSIAVFSKSRKRNLILEYREKGEYINIYTYYTPTGRTPYLLLENYNKEYYIFYYIGRHNSSAQLSNIPFLSQKDIKKGNFCSYGCIVDTAGGFYSTPSPYYKYSSDSLRGASRVYLSEIEKELLQKAIKLRVALGPEPPEYFKSQLDPYKILFFVCVPTNLKSAIDSNAHDSVDGAYQKK
jgi:hypothetical protein